MFHPKDLHQSSPEVGCEQFVSVGDQLLWYAMIGDHFLDEYPSELLGCLGFPIRNETSKLRESIGDHKDAVVRLLCHRIV
jgi:hypothetical protein